MLNPGLGVFSARQIRFSFSGDVYRALNIALQLSHYTCKTLDGEFFGRIVRRRKQPGRPICGSCRHRERSKLMIKQGSWRLSILAGALAVAAGGTAHATDCVGTLAPGSYDSLNVPATKACMITSGTVYVSGNVTVGSGASLFVRSPANFTVNSSLLAVNPFDIVILPKPMGAANILGSVSVTGPHLIIEVTIEDSFIGGTLSVANLGVDHNITLSSNNVAGNMLVRNNSSESLVIAGNTIGGSLVCSNNDKAPVNGGTANTVGGAEVGQCSGL
jgi:hypothetical protein